MVCGILDQESREKKSENIDIDKALYVPSHPRVKRLKNIIQGQFGIACIFKKSLTVGEILTKNGRQIQKEHRRNTINRIPCAECPTQ